MAEGIFGHLSTVIIKRMCNFQTRGKEPHLPKSAYEVEQPVEAQNNSISTMLSDVMEPSSSLVTTTVTSQHTNERIWKWPIAPDGKKCSIIYMLSSIHTYNNCMHIKFSNCHL